MTIYSRRTAKRTKRSIEMARPKEFLLEVTVTCDADEIDTVEKMNAKAKQIRTVIESIDPSVGVFETGDGGWY